MLFNILNARKCNEATIQAIVSRFLRLPSIQADTQSSETPPVNLSSEVSQWVNCQFDESVKILVWNNPFW